MKNFFESILQTTSLFIPAPFTCPGCRFHSWEGICQSCIQSLRRNSEILPSSTEAIHGFAPLLYSFQQTHALLKHWKDHRGSELEPHLLAMHSELQQQLKEIGFDAIVPIPQNFHRSWKRGHESAKTIAAFFSEQLRIPIVDLLQLKDENTPKQAMMTQIERDTAPNPFQCRFENRERTLAKILIVDDLITSGNTLIRAAEAIHQHLPQAQLWAASLAYRPKKTKKAVATGNSLFKTNLEPDYSESVTSEA